MPCAHVVGSVSTIKAGMGEKGKSMIRKKRVSDEPAFEYHLIDDGTLDTVLRLWCGACQTSTEHRFNECDRDSDGVITDDGWEDITEFATDNHVMECDA